VPPADTSGDAEAGRTARHLGPMTDRLGDAEVEQAWMPVG